MSFPDANDPRFKQRPAIMAIGDSVYNGTQSLTTGPGLPALSPPAQVAKALGLSMVLPNYPRDVLINLRQFLIDNKLNYKALLPDLLKNAEAWRAEVPVFAASVVAHDNVSIACSTIEDLYTRTAGQEVRKIDGL